MSPDFGTDRKPAQEAIDAYRELRQAHGAGDIARIADAAAKLHDALDAIDGDFLDEVAQQYDDEASDLATVLACDNAARST